MKARRNTVRSIIQRPNGGADTARRYLDFCELEVLEPHCSDDFVLELLYETINKKTSRRLQLPKGIFDMTTTVHGTCEDGRAAACGSPILTVFRRRLFITKGLEGGSILRDDSSGLVKPGLAVVVDDDVL